MLNGNSGNDSMVAAAVNLPPAANRSAAAFESEALPHLNDLYRTALHMLQPSAKASDAVQATYLQAWKAFGKYQGGTNCKTWLFQILINVVRHERRSGFRWNTCGNRSWSSEGRQGQTTLSDRSDAPNHGVFAMNLVPVDLMEVLLLVDGQGFSYRETAEILSLPADVVARRVVLGRDHLRSEQEVCCSTPVEVAK